MVRVTYVKGALKRKSSYAPVFFEFLTRFAILEPDWSIIRHRNAIVRVQSKNLRDARRYISDEVAMAMIRQNSE